MHGRDADDAHDPTHALRPGGPGHHRLADGQDHAATQTLQDPEEDERVGRPGHTAEARATMNRVSESIHIGLAPNRSMAQPVTGMTMARARR